MNREQRRHPEEGRPPQEQPPPQSRESLRPGPQAVENVRAKSSGHGKKTADKWNQ